jgi:hypothetical protein
MPLDLPEHEHTVSAVRLDGGNLFVRFIADYHVGTEAAAFELMASDVDDAEAVVAYLLRVQEANECLYIFERDGVVVVSDDGDDEVALKAKSVRVRLDQPNADELNRFLAQAREQYEQEYKASTGALSRLRAIQELVHEQLRRLEIKAASHEPGSAPAVLYAQNIQFLQRLLGATEA